jgi:hypothetical protein
MTDYGSEVAAAETPAGVAAAEERLAEALTEEVERIEDRYGEPEVEVTPVVPVSTASGVSKETAVRKDSQVLVSAMGVGVVEDRVLRGTADDVARQIARLLATALEVRAADLEAVTGQWVADYRGVLADAPASVVAAFEARLRGESAEGDVSSSSVRRLRSALLDVQATAEDRLLGILDGDARERLRDASRPTFFLFTAAVRAVRTQSLGNSIR